MKTMTDDRKFWLITFCIVCLVQLYQAYTTYHNAVLWAENQQIRNEVDMAILRICNGIRTISH